MEKQVCTQMGRLQMNSTTHCGDKLTSQCTCSFIATDPLVLKSPRFLCAGRSHSICVDVRVWLWEKFIRITEKDIKRGGTFYDT